MLENNALRRDFVEKDLRLAGAPPHFPDVFVPFWTGSFLIV
jgi:hypothetical protein